MKPYMFVLGFFFALLLFERPPRGQVQTIDLLRVPVRVRTT